MSNARLKWLQVRMDSGILVVAVAPIVRALGPFRATTIALVFVELPILKHKSEYRRAPSNESAYLLVVEASARITREVKYYSNLKVLGVTH